MSFDNISAFQRSSLRDANYRCNRRLGKKVTFQPMSRSISTTEMSVTVTNSPGAPSRTVFIPRRKANSACPPLTRSSSAGSIRSPSPVRRIGSNFYKREVRNMPRATWSHQPRRVYFSSRAPRSQQNKPAQTQPPSQSEPLDAASEPIRSFFSWADIAMANETALRAQLKSSRQNKQVKNGNEKGAEKQCDQSSIDKSSAESADYSNIMKPPSSWWQPVQKPEPHQPRPKVRVICSCPMKRCNCHKKGAEGYRSPNGELQLRGSEPRTVCLCQLKGFGGDLDADPIH